MPGAYRDSLGAAHSTLRIRWPYLHVTSREAKQSGKEVGLRGHWHTSHPAPLPSLRLQPCPAPWPAPHPALLITLSAR